MTAGDFVLGRYGHRGLALAVALTGILATMPYIALQLVGLEKVILALGVTGQGIMAHAPLTIAFVILALFTYKSGLRAPAMIAFVKDAMIYIFIIAAIVIIPYKLGGFGAIFEAADKAFAAKIAANPKARRGAHAETRADRSLHHARHRFRDGALHVSARADRHARRLEWASDPLQHDDVAGLFLRAWPDRAAWAHGDRRRRQGRHAAGCSAAARALGVSRTGSPAFALQRSRSARSCPRR